MYQVPQMISPVDFDGGFPLAYFCYRNPVILTAVEVTEKGNLVHQHCR
jgi:hypothetical protein